MTASTTIATPLGQLLLSVMCEPGEDTAPGSALAVEFVARRITLPAHHQASFPATVCWGITIDLHAATDTGPVTIAALLPEDIVRGDFTADEDLTAIEFLTTDWVLAIAGIDEVGLSREAHEGHQPASWKDLDMPADDGAGRRGLRWHLPGLVPGDHGHMFVEVAWCRTGHPNSLDAPFGAVGRVENQRQT